MLLKNKKGIFPNFSEEGGCLMKKKKVLWLMGFGSSFDVPWSFDYQSAFSMKNAVWNEIRGPTGTADQNTR
jgi:hypothetical protein